MFNFYAELNNTFTTIMIRSIVVVSHKHPFFFYRNGKKTTHASNLCSNTESRQSLPISYKKPYARISTVGWMLMEPYVVLHFPGQRIILLIWSSYLQEQIRAHHLLDNKLQINPAMHQCILDLVFILKLLTFNLLVNILFTVNLRCQGHNWFLNKCNN